MASASSSADGVERVVRQGAHPLVREAVGDVMREEDAAEAAGAEPEEPYYWDKPGEEGLEAPTSQKVGHWAHWGGSKALEGAEFMGEVFANFFGLTQSKYQWVIDAKQREEEEAAQHALEERQRRELLLQKMIDEEKKKLAELEGGGGDCSDDAAAATANAGL